jgi:phosphohistidine phosphatase SixA
MKSVLSVLIVAGMVLVTPSIAEAQQTVIFVRHAERADGGAGAQPSQPGMTAAPADPLLSAAGEARAARLATMLADAGITAIYTTEFRRTQDTAKPLAAKLGLKPQVTVANDPVALVTRVKAEQPKGVVLIVSHSNRVPDAIKAFGGREVKIADDDYSGIYILTPATGALTLIRY